MNIRYPKIYQLKVNGVEYECCHDPKGFASCDACLRESLVIAYNLGVEAAIGRALLWVWHSPNIDLPAFVETARIKP